MRALVKSTVREIRSSLGRYLAIFAIIALGVGFFAGLRLCRPTLASSAETYYNNSNFYDFRLMSSIGFSKDSIRTESEFSDIEGAIYQDVLVTDGSNNIVVRVHSITQKVNKLSLVSGRLPQTDTECVVDANYFGEEIIGKQLVFSEETGEVFSHTEYTVTGTVKSPLYISNDRGTTSLGDGNIAAFAFVSPSCFKADYFTELYAVANSGEELYSEAYKNMISDKKPSVTVWTENIAMARYQEIVAEAQSEIDSGKSELDKANQELKAQKDAAIRQLVEQLTLMGIPATEDNPYYAAGLDEINASFSEYEAELSAKYEELENASQEVYQIEEPTVFVLTRAENAGYTSFEQDSTIIENISVVFPIFFFLVAGLVCITTMTRMVDEQRTQIGVFKALGYGKLRIASKYLFYAGSAGLLGSVLGFFVGTLSIPTIFWAAYRTVYNFTDKLKYVFDISMLSISVCVAVLCTAGVTLLCCYKELSDVPAAILRPKAPKIGKRIFLERIKPLWSRIGFLQKVSLRNVFRYKQRFVMMILGICGCTALLVTGFGVRDSIQNVTDYQYGEITLYDAEITFSEVLDENGQTDFITANETIDNILFLSDCNVDIVTERGSMSVKLSGVTSGDITRFLRLKNEDGEIRYPLDNEAVVSKGIAERLGIHTGDTLTLKDDDFHTISVTVSGVMDNYIGNYLFVNENTIASFIGEAPTTSAYVNFKEGTDLGTASAAMLKEETVSHVSLNEDMKSSIETSFESLNLVVVLIIVCAGILAFVVLFNLININIGERIREIATIKVLGFYNGESSEYIFREVNILTVIGGAVGIGLGKLLHSFVMDQIKPDGICFDSRIAWYSYVLGFILTLLFAELVKIVMRRKLKKIQMAESLKSVE